MILIIKNSQKLGVKGINNLRLLMVLVFIVGVGSLGGCSSAVNTTSHFSENNTSIVSNASNAGRLVSTAANLKVGTPDTKQRQKVSFSAAQNTNGSAYFIGVQDVIEVSVYRVADLSKTVQVSDAGTVNLPLVGTIKAAGLTARQVEQVLTAKLGAKYLQNPQVSVFVKGFHSQSVTISGAVKKQGVFPIRGRTTLVSLIAMSGGFKEASDSTVVVFRTRHGKQEAARFNVAAIQNGTTQDPVIQSGDRIVAGHSIIKSTFNNILKALPIIGKFALL